MKFKDNDSRQIVEYLEAVFKSYEERDLPIGKLELIFILIETMEVFNAPFYAKFSFKTWYFFLKNLKKPKSKKDISRRELELERVLLAISNARIAMNNQKINEILNANDSYFYAFQGEYTEKEINRRTKKAYEKLMEVTNQKIK